MLSNFARRTAVRAVNQQQVRNLGTNKRAQEAAAKNFPALWEDTKNLIVRPAIT